MKRFNKYFYKSKNFKILFILLVIFIFDGCTIPFIGGKRGNSVSSIFNKESYLNVNEYSFREYEWNRDSRAAEEIYIRGLSDYFFKGQYDRAEVIFNSALKIYRKDARIYTRLAECYARLGDFSKALSLLNMGANEIFGFDTLPGIIRYRNELNDKISESSQLATKKKRNIIIRILTYPGKLFSF